MDSKTWLLALALLLGIAGMFGALAIMGRNGILPFPIPLMSN